MKHAVALHALCATLLAAVLAGCGTTPPAPPRDGPAEAPRPKVDTPQEDAAPSESLGAKPAEVRPGDDPKLPAPPSPQPPPAPSPTPDGDKPIPPAAPRAGDEPKVDTGDKPKADTPTGDKAKTDVPGDDKPKADAPDGDKPPADGEQNKPGTEALPQEEGLLEQTRRTVQSTTLWLARGVDSWFGDKPFEQGGRVTDGRLSMSMLKRQDESIDFKVRFNARVRLPNIEQRTYFFLGRDNDRETVADTPGALSRQDRLLAESRDDRTFFAGFGYALREAFDLRLGFHGIKPYAQARYRDTWNLTLRDLIEFRQTFFWRTSDHFGSTTAVSYEHAYSSTLAFRWLSASTRTQKTRFFDWSSIAGVYKGFAGERLLSLEYIVSGAQHTKMLFTEHGAQTKWSQPVYRDWLFCEFIVGLYFPRRAVFENRDRVWAFGTGVTMRF